MPVRGVPFDIPDSSYGLYCDVSRVGVVGQRPADNFILLSFTVTAVLMTNFSLFFTKWLFNN